VLLFPTQISAGCPKSAADDFLHIKMTHIGMDRLIRTWTFEPTGFSLQHDHRCHAASSAIMHATGAGPVLQRHIPLGLSAFFSLPSAPCIDLFVERMIRSCNARAEAKRRLTGEKDMPL